MVVPNYAKLARLRFIDCLLEHYGTINRAQIADYFGVSIPQASHDLNEYIEHAPGNIEYDKTGKTYRRTEAFKRVFP